MRISFDSNADIKISMTDNRDLAEDLSVYSRANLVIRASLSGAALVSRTTDPTATLTIGADFVLADGISSGEWATLSTGTYLMDVLLFHTATSEWHRTERINVEFIKGVSGELA